MAIRGRDRAEVLLLLAFAVAALATPGEAHNGAFAYAAPVQGIVVDGDLSDWPDSLTHHAIEDREVGPRPTGPADFGAWFRVGYARDEGALYLAVEVTDESTVIDDPVIDDPLAGVWQQDGCEVYLARRHQAATEPDSPGTPSVGQYAVWGRHHLANLGGAVDRAPLAELPAGVEVAVVRAARRHVYEWRFDLRQLGGGADTGPADVGFDIAIPDLDEDGSFTWTAWGPTTLKFQPRHLGDLALASSQGVGDVAIEATWPSGAPGDVPIRLTSSDGQGRYYILWPDSAGTARGTVPVGEYSLATASGVRAANSLRELRAADALAPTGIGAGDTTLSVAAGDDAVARVVLEPLEPRTGHEVIAGEGRVQHVGPGSWKGPWHSLTPADGLAGGASVLGKAADGALWLGTQWFQGVTRFDGQTLHTLTTEDGWPGEVSAIEALPTGTVWFGTAAGQLVRVDGPSFTAFDVREGLPAERIQALAQDQDGGLWIGFQFGPLLRYDGEHFRRFGRGDGLGGSAWNHHDILVADDGAVWVSAGGVGVYRFDGHRFAELPAFSGLTILAMVQDRDGAVWLAPDRHSGGGVLRYNKGVVTRFTAEDGLAEDEVSRILVADDGVWFATWNGVTRYDGRAFVSFGARDGIGHDAVNDLVLDDAGRLWLGTWGGLSCYDSRRLAQYTAADGLASDDIIGLARDGDGLWLVHRQGDLTHFDGRRFTTAMRPRAERSWTLDVLRDASGALWLTTSSGVARYDGRGFASLDLEVSYAFALGVSAAREGGLWFAVWPSDVLRYDGQQVVEHLTRADGLPAAALSVLEDRDGDLWVGHAKGFVSHRHGDEVTVRELEIGDILSIYQVAGGDLWFGGTYAAARYDGESFHTYPMPGVVWDILERTNGEVWFCTGSGGVVRTDGIAFQHLTERDGIPGGAANAAVESATGGVWIGTSQGLVHYQPETDPPTVAIAGVTADREYGPVTTVRLTSLQEVVRFDLEATSPTTAPEQMVYLHRLLGYDDTWQQADGPRVDYADLPRGDYTFEAVAVDRDLNRSPEPARVAVTVTLPYERLSLISALALALLAVAWQGTRAVQRGRHLRAANRDLTERTAQLEAANRQVQEATRNKSEFLRRMSHDLRSPMNAIIGYTRLVLRKAAGTLDARQVRNLENIHTSADNLLALINDILDLSRVEAGRLELHLQDADLRHLVDECADGLAPLVKPGVRLERQLEDVGTVRTDLERLRQVVMNLLGNAAKFTDEGRITVSLRATPAGAQLRVADTGVGIPADDLPHIFTEFRQVQRQGGEQTEGTGLGLSIARKLVELLGGSIEAASEVGVGTTFTVRLPTA